MQSSNIYAYIAGPQVQEALSQKIEQIKVLGSIARVARLVILVEVYSIPIGADIKNCPRKDIAAVNSTYAPRLIINRLKQKKYIVLKDPLKKYILAIIGLQIEEIANLIINKGLVLDRMLLTITRYNTGFIAT